VSRPAAAHPAAPDPALARVPARRPRPLLAALAIAVVFAAATPWVLRPWFTASDAFPRDRGTLGSLQDTDLYLNVWILAWVAHALVTDPAHLFDGNIYYPARNTLAGSEHMLAHVPATLPAHLFGGDALTVLKAMVLESFVLAGLAMFALVWRHTRDVPAALVAGAAFTFAPWRVNTLPQPQYLGAAYLPLALLAVDAWVEDGHRRAVAGLAAALALQTLACFYLGYFAFAVVPVYAAVRVAQLRGGRRRALLGLVAGTAAGALLVIPAALPYLHERAARTIRTYDVESLIEFSCPPWRYLDPGFVQTLLGPVPHVLVGLGLVAAAAAWLRGRRAMRRGGPPLAATWALVAAGVVLSAGPYLRTGTGLLPLPYLLPYWFAPGFSSMRAPFRFYIVVATGLAALAGYALARLAPRRPAVRWTVAAALTVACVVSAAPRPSGIMPARLRTGTPGAYAWLAAQPAGDALLEIPSTLTLGDFRGQLRSARQMVFSTVHWHPLLNGYTAYPPPTTPFVESLTTALPDPGAFAVLVDTVDVRWILVHGGEVSRAARDGFAALSPAGLRLAARFGTDDLYEVTRPPAHPWRAALLPRAQAPAADTLEGTPTAALAPPCRTARFLEVRAPKVMYPAPVPIPVGVRLENASDCTWPALGVRADGLVGLAYRWTAPDGTPAPRGRFSRLLGDVPPHATVDARAWVYAPSARGAWRLDVLLVQEGTETPLATATVAVDVTTELRRNAAAQPRGRS
jgi:hypothetical protein